MAAPNPEKQPFPPPEQQYYPPPPPGAPPAQSNQPYFPPPPAGGPPTQQPHPLQQHPPANYQIPAYDPAHPQFAPPPADVVNDELRPPPSPVGGATPTTPTKQHGGWSERLHHMGMKAADPINALANKMGSQSFLPMSLEKECEKAAVILSSFCKDGVVTETEFPIDPATAPPPAADKPHDKHDKHDKHSKHDKHDKPSKEKPRQKALLKIPPRVIQKAHGLAIFTVARVGFHLSGATGSGIVVARRDDGAWSPPSGIQVHSVGAGFMIGADIYDCVCVLNSKEALDAFMNTRVSLGSDLAVVAGPYGAGGAIEVGRATATEKPDGINRHGEPNTPTLAPGTTPTAGAPTPGVDDGKLKPDGKPGHKRSSSRNSLKPVFSYVKSRGLYAGISVDGTVITERKEANAAFYGTPVSVQQILGAQVPDRWSAIRSLGVALSAAQAGKSDMPEVAAPMPTTAPQQQPFQQPPYQPQPFPQQPPQQQQPYQMPYYHQAPPQQSQQNVPGVVSVPLERVDHPARPGPDISAPPAYVDDGKPHPGTGDQKAHYQ